MNDSRWKEKPLYDLPKLKIYLEDLIQSIPQVIVQSRCGARSHHEIVYSPRSRRKVYEIAINGNAEIQEKIISACTSFHPLNEFCLNIEILLKTADGAILTLEVWTLRQKKSEDFWNPRFKIFADLEIVYGSLMLLLKSVISVTRVMPAFKLSFQQSSTSYVLLYRVYPGEPQVDQLGKTPQLNKIGEVYTPVGSISITVAYRSKLDITIAPQSADKDNTFELKNNYFDLKKSPKKQCNRRLDFSNSEICKSATDTENFGAFAPSSTLPDASFPELEFLKKPFLNLSRVSSEHYEKRNSNFSNNKQNVKFRLLGDSQKINSSDQKENEDDRKLSVSEASDIGDFVLVDLKKPPFACQDCTYHLGAFFQECEHAPELHSFSSHESLGKQLFDATGQLEKYEAIKNEFDNFVDSVCQKNIQSL